jgi:D-methionine transport system substrate-binding protein
MKTLVSQKHLSSHKFTLASILAVLVVTSFVLSACATATATPTAAATTAATTAAPATEAATVAATAAATKTPIHIKIGVSPVPHGDIINYIKENLAPAAGLDIEVVEFTDYVQPNLALADGTLDANYFQHVPYLNDFNKEHKTDLVPVVAVHIEPLGIYSKKIKSLTDITDGAVVAIPNDATNAGRALNLLAANNLITLKDGVGYSATVNDITANPKKLKITELEAAQLVRSLDDTTISVINGNYALEGKLTPSKDALALESAKDNPYANVLVVKKGHENDEGIQILAKLLTSPEVKKFIEDKYSGSVIPAF